MTKPTISTFNELSEMLIQKYERYLPTAFDEGLSILQKLNKIIKYLDDTGKLVNDVVKQWNDVFEWIMGEGMNEDIAARLDELIADGTFDTIINHTIFEDLNRKIEDVVVNVKNYGVKGDGVTDDQAKLVEIYQLAYTNGWTLHFPKGTYISTANIPYFHDVHTEGKGIIKRGTALFHITPLFNQINILYTGYGSNPVNDGLSENYPRGLTQVRDTLQNLGHKASMGQWRIQFTGGMTQENGIVFNNMPYFSKPLQIWGKYDGVTHLSVWDGTLSSPVYAIRADGINNSLFLEFKDLKFQNWKGHVSNAGAIVTWQGVNVRTDNVFAIDCTIGIWCRGGYSRHYGDRIENCVWGYGFQYSHTFTIGSSIYNRNKIINCEKGVFVGRTTVGHVDYTDFSNCTVCLQAHQKSRIASVQANFATWEDVCIWLQGDSIFEDDGSTWDANSITDDKPIYRLNNGSSVPAIHTDQSPYRVAHFVPNAGYTVAGGTLDSLISSQAGFGSPLRNMPKHYLYNNAQIQLFVKIRVDVGGSGGTKSLKLAGANATSQVIAELTIPAGGGLGEATFEVNFRANGTAIVKSRYESSNPALNTVAFTTVPASVITALRDKSADLTHWRLYGSTPTAGDSMTVYAITSMLVG